MFDKLFKRPSANAAPSSSTEPSPPVKKASLYRRFQDAKRGELKEEDVLKYTGKTKSEIIQWSATAPGVAGNQPAGKVNIGSASGLGGAVGGDDVSG